MQGVGNRTKITLAVVTGISTGLGFALLTRRMGWRLSRLFSSHKSFGNMKVIVARNENQCATLVNTLNGDIEVTKVLGFDCEWVQTGNKRNRVALVQLATREGQCGLFQIHLYSAVPQPLQDLLEDKNILKVGVVPSIDAKFLLEDYGIQVTGTVDIRHLVNSHGRDSIGGLAAVVNTELGVQLSKDYSVRVSNWEAEDLSSEQQIYAAKDALSSLLVFNKLILEKVKLPYFSSKENQWREIYKFCEPFIDVHFKDKRRKPSSQVELPKQSPSHILERDSSGMPHNSSPGSQGKKFYRAFCPRKSPLYENAFMLAPDGTVLCTCDKKKAEWYVSKRLATIVDIEPFKIQLTFEPAGRVNGPSGQYYTTEKENKCVTCGRKDSYLRKKIVPHEYRKYFPDSMKKHQSHDILLMCAPCHAQSNISDYQLRLELAKLCDAPFGSDDRVFEDNRNKMLRSAARALFHKSHQLPEKRVRELTDYIQDNCHQHVTENLLIELKELDISVINEDYVPHGLLVVEYFARDNVKGLMRLEKIWREHFIKEMNPQHLPPLWSVDHYHDDERNYILDSEFLKKVKSVRNID